MPSFLEKLNQQSSEGKIVKPGAEGRKEAPADTSAIGHLAGAAMPGQSNPKPAAPRPASAEPAPSAAPSAAGEERGGIRTTEHDIEIDRGYGRRRLIQIISGILACVILVAGIAVAMRYFTMVEIPDFTGKTIAEMKRWCIDNKIYVTESPVYSMEIDEDYVIRQSVEGGAKLSPKKTIEVTYSLGADPKEKITVPDLMSMTAPDISDWGKANKLLKLNIIEEYNNEYDKGMVIRYSFGSASISEKNFTRGDSLTVNVSRGPSDYGSYMKIRDYRGSYRTEAETWCNNYGIKAIFSEAASDTVAEGRIISQSVEVGKILNYGDTVEFVVSTGAGVTVPDFSEIFKENVNSAAAGLNVVVKSVYSSDVPYGGFISQSAEPGSQVTKKDSEVVVYYSLGKPYIGNLVGMRENEIDSMLYDYNRQGAALTRNIIYVDSKAPKGTVVSASRGSEWVELNAFIEFEVSRGNLSDEGSSENPGKLYTVPNYSSVLKDDAAAYDRNVSVEIVMRYSDSVAYGRLISQSAPAGSWMTMGDKVTLVYSVGRPYVGDYVGLNESELQAVSYEFTRMGAGVSFQVEYVASAEPRGTIVSASKQSEYVLMNEVILIQVSLGS